MALGGVELLGCLGALPSVCQHHAWPGLHMGLHAAERLAAGAGRVGGRGKGQGAIGSSRRSWQCLVQIAAGMQRASMSTGLLWLGT